MTDESLHRLAAAVRRRRLQLGLAQGDLIRLGGPSEQTVRKIEQAHAGPYRRQTVGSLETILGWAPGTVGRVLAGAADHNPDAWIVERTEPDEFQPVDAAASDIAAVSGVLHRLTSARLTPKGEAAVRALLDLMPELLAEETTA